MAKEPQPLMYSNKDIDLIKSAFAENDEILISIRKLFFGVEVSGDEKESIKSTFSNPELVDVFRRKVYGVNNFDTPVGQLSDFWLGAESQIFGATRDTVFQVIESKKMVLEMFEKSFKLLNNPDGEKVTVEFTANSLVDDLGVNLIARNLYMKAIETSLLSLKALAGKKTESVEETVKRLQRDSSK